MLAQALFEVDRGARVERAVPTAEEIDVGQEAGDLYLGAR